MFTPRSSLNHLLLVLLLLSLRLDAKVTSFPLAPRSQSNGTTLFEKLPADQTGLKHVNGIDTKHPYKYVYVGGYACGGLAIGDVDGDGLQDIFAAGGSGKNTLYLQKKGTSLRFADATSKVPGLDGGDLWAAGAALADIDADGDLDLYICHFDAPNQLYLNDTQVPGEPIFTESAGPLGLAIKDASFMPSFCDYDNDGDLDLFVLGYQYRDPKGRPKRVADASGEVLVADDQGFLVQKRNGKYEVRPGSEKYYAMTKDEFGKPKFGSAGRPDYLMRNDGGKFTNVSAKAGITGIGVGNSATWFDSDADGDLDLYIANDFKVADQFFRNNGDGTFKDVVKDVVPHTAWFSMGSDVGDLNNDGLLDLIVTDMAGTTHYRSKVSMGEMSNNADFLRLADPQQYMRNAVYVNTGTPRFMEAAYLTGLANTDWTWAVKLADYDNDGRVDAFFTNGSARMFNHSDFSTKTGDRVGKTEWDLWESFDERHEENLAFQNQGDLKFKNVSANWGVSSPTMSYACAHGDLDNDGDLDLLVADLNQPIAIYQNHSRGNSLQLRLQGANKNRHGLGARVEARVGPRKQALALMPTTGFLSNNDSYLHLGLGEASVADEIAIHWPGGGRQVLKDLAAGKIHHVVQDSNAKPEAPEPPNPLFATMSSMPALKHLEKDYDDFARQPLLPNKHSQLGPGMAIGDIDGDGDDDFYLGRSRGGRRAIYTNAGGGRMTVQSMAPFQGEEIYEDLGALFFDADRDGDQDLYVVSGGVEGEPGDACFQDRLYVNGGKGNFTKSIGALPKLADSGGVVVAGDIDRDGDLDLFVGGRVIPGKYPETPASRLLVNQSVEGQPRFVDETTARAPNLSSTGLVTGAVWSDANADGWLDLLVTHEWGPVKYYQNQQGQLVEKTKEAGLADRLGWWNGIASGDVDGDGDLDYLATNFGLNTKYKASKEKPERLYYGDFDNTGNPHLVEAKSEKGLWVPRRGLSCSSHAMPFVREKMGTFHNFGMASLQELYTTPKLDSALRMEANTLESGWFINQGTDKKTGAPRFNFQALPRLCQVAPGFGAVVTDLDGDGDTDAFMAQNFHGPQVETGRMDGGLSLWLRGNGNGQFAATGPRESGISVRGDAAGASLVDFNQDNCPDLLVSVNNGIMEAYDNRARQMTKNRFIKVQMKGPPGNPTCVGARVRLRFADEAANPAQLAEMQAGGGYLSQSTAAVFFGCGQKAKAVALEVVWPDGKAIRYKLTQSAGAVTVPMPE